MALYDPDAYPQQLAAPAQPQQTLAQRVLAAAVADPAAFARRLGLKPQQVLNLYKLATYLRALPAGYGHFDMASYYHAAGAEELSTENMYADSYPHHCGTAACAVGHAPAAGVVTLHNETWFEYGTRCFTSTYFDFLFLFGGGWHSIDNTVRGAAARMVCYLDGGFDSSRDDLDYLRMLPRYQPYLA